MPDRSPILLWFRRDLRLSDHPALHGAARSGRPVIPVFLCDEGVEALGAAPRMRIGMGVGALERSLEGIGSRLVLRQGGALATLRALAAETGAGAVWWTLLHDPLSRRRDAEVMEGLAIAGVEARAFPGHLLFEPETVRTRAGSFFKVYGPFFRTIRRMDAGEPLPAPSRLPRPRPGPRANGWRAGGLERP